MKIQHPRDSRGDAMYRVSTIHTGTLVTHVYGTRALMGRDAAKMVGKKIKSLFKQQDFVNIIFAAAPSQNEFLAEMVKDRSIDWNRVNAFHMDEYIGLPKNDPRTFASFLKEKIFSLLPFCSVSYINGNTANLQNECERYAALLIKYPPDIVCMGIGENGHIAFNDPPIADFNDPVKVKIVRLDAECRQQQVNDGCFDEIENVPAHALTLTIPSLMAARYVYCIVPAEKKAKAVYNTLHAEIIENYPSTILRNHPDAVLFLDKDSSSLL